MTNIELLQDPVLWAVVVLNLTASAYMLRVFLKTNPGYPPPAPHIPFVDLEESDEDES